MTPRDSAVPAIAAPAPRWFRIGTAIILICYAAILARGIRNPWTGLHDWNGAFYSQLARNLLRYPFDMHHGMPIAAVGEAVPADGEWSFYPTHPPGLVWCIAASFQLFGEHEWAARLVSIIASLGTLALICHAVRARYGETTALTASAIYALLPMAGYFGRMPDQEALCLFLMFAAVVAVDRQFDPPPGPAPRLRPGFIWSVCIFAAIWVDWVAIILAGLVGLRALVETLRGRLTPGRFARIIAAPATAIILLFVYLVQVGFAGRTADLFAVFTARAGVTLDASAPALHKWIAWTNTVENLTLPVLILALIGIGVSIARAIASQQDGPQRHDAAITHARFADGLTLLAITGMLWVAIFWRQYLVHQYWLVYLGPAAALLAATGLMTICNRIAAFAPAVAKAVFAAIAIVIVSGSHFATIDLHQRVHCPKSDVDAWRAARLLVVRYLGQGNERGIPPPPVLLTRNPIRVEHRGAYAFRNIVPPQFAYYFDLPFVVESDVDRLSKLLPDSSGLLMPTRFAAEHAGEISTRLRRLEHYSYGTWEFFREPN